MQHPRDDQRVFARDRLSLLRVPAWAAIGAWVPASSCGAWHCSASLSAVCRHGRVTAGPQRLIYLHTHTTAIQGPGLAQPKSTGPLNAPLGKVFLAQPFY